MSSVRGGNPRDRGRGSTPLAPRGRGRGASASRGRISSNGNSQRVTPSPRASFGQTTRGIANWRGRGSNGTRGNGSAQASSTRAAFGGAKLGGNNWKERYQKLNEARDRERVDAIRQGLVADPDKPRALSEAITPVGTCQDMCAEFERVQRVVQDDVWAEEKVPDNEPDESRMVKKFRRSAAGLDEQLPSDLRPPHVLKRTCDYLFDDIIGHASSLAQVHHFVWDRTRAIRNDFSIQQLTKLDELRIAVDCYERIARFHILSMHQLASASRQYAQYDWKQEREQLDRTLLSLMQYYEDTRGRINFSHEAEFRAYCVVFQLQSPTPDLEDSVQAWPRSILQDRRVRKALDVYAAGCTVMRPQGPVQPRASHLIARQDWQRVWVLLASNEVSYLMACVAEIYFNLIRQTVLNALFRTFRANATIATPDWTLDVLCEFFAFDDEREVITYCEYFGFSFKEREDGQEYLDLSSVPGKMLPQPKAGMPEQLKSSLVEDKRLGRTLPAVINGLAVRQAQAAGMIVDEEHDEGMEDVQDVQDGSWHDLGSMDEQQTAEDDEDSLFIPQDKPPRVEEADKAPALPQGLDSQANPFLSSFGKPSGGTDSPFGKSAAAVHSSSSWTSAPKFDFLGGAAKTGTSKTSEKPRLNFLGTTSKPAAKTSAGSPVFNAAEAGPETSEANPQIKPMFSLPGLPMYKAAPAISAPGFDFTGGNGLGAYSTADSNTNTDSQSNKDGVDSTQRQPLTATQQSSFGSKPAGEQRSAVGPFHFPKSNMAAESKPSQLFPGASPQSATVSTTADPAVEARISSKGPFLDSAPNSPAPTASETAPSLSSSQTKQSQPLYTAPAANTPSSPSSPPTSNSSLNTGLRRPSTTSTDTRPKKPSPLSHSFTAGGDSSAPARGQQAESTAPKNVASETSLRKEQPLPQLRNRQPAYPQAHTASPAPLESSQLKKPTPFQRNRSPSTEATEDFEATLTRVAKELVEDEVSGYLKQYIEYKVSQTITSVQEGIADEKMKLRLSELRISTLCRKYLRRWISLVWQRRLAKSGKDRRQRRRKRLQDGFDDGGARNDESVRGSSKPGSVTGSDVSWKGHQESVDAMFRRTMISKSLAQPLPTDQQAKAGSKRPSSAHGDNLAVSRASAHKRLKSTSHVDDRGRVTKSTTSTSLNEDIVKRSSFLGFSLKGPSPPNKNTTKSNYFRLKALGIHRADELSAPRGIKRPQAESTQLAATSPPRLRNSLSIGPSSEGSSNNSLMLPPASTVSRTQKAKEEDDALFARMRAARESLTLGTTYMRSEMDRDDKIRRSLSASRSSTESPSMSKARTEARARHSRNSSPERDVPAYRLRESKFVPREQYGKAIERAKEMRESRSREASRPASRLGHPTEDVPTAIGGYPFDTAVNSDKSKEGNSSAQSSAFATAAKPFSPFISNAPVSFADHTTEISDSNPFLQSIARESSKMSNANPFSHFTTFNNHAVDKPADPQPFGLESTLGMQSEFGAPSAFDSKMCPNSQPSGLGFHAAFCSQPAASSGPSFGSPYPFASKPSFGNDAPHSSFAARDYTVQPQQVDQSLVNSFGNQHMQHPLEKEFVPPQQSSYIHTRTVSLLSENEEEQEDALSQQTRQASHINGFYHDEDEELLDTVTDEDVFESPYVQANPDTMLANHEDNDENGSQSPGLRKKLYDQRQSDEDERLAGNEFQSQDDFSNDTDVGFDGVYYGGEDEEAANGDIDDETDIDDSDECDVSDLEADEECEEDEEEEEEEPPQPWQNAKQADRYTAKAQPNAAMQGMGKTEDAPIELDSD